MIPTTHFVQNGDLTSAYHEVGEGHPFVLVHGYTGSKLDFQDQLPGFADQRRTLAYDQRGHGESTNQLPYRLDVLADDLVTLLDALHIERCDLLGHSLGGMVALRAVLAHPERFTSLVLMDTAAAPLEGMPAAARAAIHAQVAEQGCAALLEAMRAMPVARGQQAGIDLLGAEEHWRRIEVKLDQMDRDAFAGLGAELAEYAPLTDDLPQIRCPTTVIVGEHDRPFLEPARALAKGIPGARLEIIPGAAHCPQYENAVAWRRAVRTHLDSAAPLFVAK